MTAYIIRRLWQACIVVILVTVLVFLLVRLLPGDPVLLYVSMDEFNEVTTEEELAALRHEFGLDRPLYVQYADWISGVVQGDLGDSIFLNVAVTEEMGNALPKTMFLGVLAWILAISIGIPFGIIAAIRRGRWIDTIVTVLSNVGITAPIFWVGIMLIHIFAVTLGWLPVQGYTSVFSDPVLGIKKIIMPIFCLALFPMAGTSRQTRSAMLEVVRQDYIRTAWAKGLSEFTITMRHALKNGVIPIITLAGMQIRGIIGGSVLIESVFNIPGMGRLAVEGLQNQDYAIVQGVILMIAIITTALNLIVDISYGYIDPRIRHS
ncbi:MAG: ABC transporter permease [Deltaproteobacteria bacterium]|nr:ABC transporter permease [Deltaproteobacteria bacterium]